jgi:hypothetical protein
VLVRPSAAIYFYFRLSPFVDVGARVWPIFSKAMVIIQTASATLLETGALTLTPIPNQNLINTDSLVRSTHNRSTPRPPLLLSPLTSPLIMLILERVCMAEIAYLSRRLCSVQPGNL